MLRTISAEWLFKLQIILWSYPTVGWDCEMGGSRCDFMITRCSHLTTPSYVFKCTALCELLSHASINTCAHTPSCSFAIMLRWTIIPGNAAASYSDIGHLMCHSYIRFHAQHGVNLKERLLWFRHSLQDVQVLMFAAAWCNGHVRTPHRWKSSDWETGYFGVWMAKYFPRSCRC